MPFSLAIIQQNFQRNLSGKFVSYELLSVGNDPREQWKGVFGMCYALDHAVRFETDDLVKGCKVLEVKVDFVHQAYNHDVQL